MPLANTLPKHPPAKPRPNTGEVKLRPWQKEAYGVYQDAVTRGGKSLLWEATPGAGKTTAALVVCLHQVKRAAANTVLIVVPTAHLKIQWARAGARVGLHLDANFAPSRAGLSRDFHGAVVTYQQLAQHPAAFKRLSAKAVVVLDEVHHAGDGLTWGQSLRIALHDSQFILCLSGTPFRSDNNPIPFVPYDEHGFSIPDYSYSYSRAVEEGVCRPTAFFTYGGEVAWMEEAGEAAARFSDALDRVGSSRRLRAALDVDSGWITPMLTDAHRVLVATRREHPDAGALLVAPDQTSARKMAKLITAITGSAPCVVLSEEAAASSRLKKFRDSDEPWLVACNMVSEGVDIPRLRVGVYATTVRTKMYFRQFLGRIVRRIPTLSCLQVAYCYLPADPSLSVLAAQIEDEIRHCIRPRSEDDSIELDREAKNRDEPNPTSWQALASSNSGIDAVIVHGNQLALFPGGQQFDEVHQEVNRSVVARLDERRSRTECKAELAIEIRKLVNIYHKRSRKTHAQIHQQLNAEQGLKSQTVSTEKQLRERVSILKRLAFG